MGYNDFFIKTIKNVSGMIQYSQKKDFIRECSNIYDFDIFKKKMNDVSNQHDFDDILIFLDEKKDKEEYEKSFLSKYQKYLLNELKEDKLVYYTNEYCSYLLRKFIDNYSPNNEVFIDGENIEDIMKMNEQKLGSLMTSDSINDKEKRFVENMLIDWAYHDEIYIEDGELGPLIVEYFKKNPINNLDSVRNRKLFLIKFFSEKLCEFSSVSKFNLNETGDIYNVEGTFFSNSNPPKLTVFRCGNVDLKEDEDFIKNIFATLHEIRHFYQKVNIDMYSNEMKKLMNIEDTVASNNNSFYLKYHDNFFIERDADNYASVQLENELGSLFGDKTNYVINSILGTRKIISSDEYYGKLYDAYSKIDVNYKESETMKK